VVGWLKKQGRSVEDAARLVGRQVPEWTAADLEQIKAWVIAPATANAKENA
jgi:hypothetical protein